MAKFCPCQVVDGEFLSLPRSKRRISVLSMANSFSRWSWLFLLSFPCCPSQVAKTWEGQLGRDRENLGGTGCGHIYMFLGLLTLYPWQFDRLIFHAKSFQYEKLRNYFTLTALMMIQTRTVAISLLETNLHIGCGTSSSWIRAVRLRAPNMDDITMCDSNVLRVWS